MIADRLPLLLVASMAVSAAWADATVTRWPLTPTDQEHPVTATIELKHDASYTYMHEGIDIPAKPITAPGAQNAVVTVSGHVDHWLTVMNAGTLVNKVVIVAADGTSYVYGHLSPPLTFAFQQAMNADEVVPAGTIIGPVGEWPDTCAGGFRHDHLHYAIRGVAGGVHSVMDPLHELAPVDDQGEPVIRGIDFCDDDAVYAGPLGPWQNCAGPVTNRCHKVQGLKDIVVGIEDRHRVGTAGTIPDNLGVRRVRYRVCGEEAPDCRNWYPAIDFALIPQNWTVSLQPPVYEHYSLRHPYASHTDVCAGDRFYVVATNVGGTLPGRAGTWDTGNLDDGFYSVAVETEDFAGNVAVESVPVCVRNGPGCFGKLLVRDCAIDNGAEPSPCPPASSPAVELILPAPPDPSVFHPPVRYRVCAVNIGCRTIPGPREIAFKVNAKLQNDAGSWAKETAIHREAMMLTTSTGTAPATPGWKPGTTRCATVTVGAWADLLTPGTLRSLAQVEVGMAGDGPNDAKLPGHDNNRTSRRDTLSISGI